MKQEERKMNKRLISIVVAVLMVLTLTPYIYAESTVTGGSRITSNGTYQVDPSATGTISIDAGKIVTLVGSGTDAEANQELSIQCGKGVNLTLKNLCITNNSDLNILDFTGTGNVLKASGTNVLESIAYTPKAAIHVGPDADLSFQDGGGVLYLYKRTQGSGIGSDAEEANGTITFDGGTWFVKGTKTGAVIGNDTCGDAEKEAQIGDITINGGELYVEANARGAAIGGSNMSAAGNVNMTGGLVTIYNDYSASSIGAGQSMLGTAEKNGTLTVTGGSLKLYLTRNGSAAWGTEMGLNDITLKAAKTNGNGSTPIYKYALDVSGASSPYTVKVDNKDYYSGSGHDYEFTPDTSSTTANWTKKSEDQQLYLYLPAGQHTVSVNDGEAQPITVEETQYATDVAVQIPEGSWADHAKTDWYSNDKTVFTLKTNEQLAGLAAIVNNGTDSFENKTVRLGADIDLSAYEWEPVGSKGYSITSTGAMCFKGNFDGQGYGISGLYYYEYNTNADSDEFSQDIRGGLFAYSEGSTFQNIVIESGYISCARNASAIAGEAPDGRFINCENNADIVPLRKIYKSGWDFGDYSAGICGYGGVYFENCRNYGKVDGNKELAGIISKGGNGCKVTGCENHGKISTLWDGNAAGIICRADSTCAVRNCANFGDVTSAIGEASGICPGFSLRSVEISGCVNGGNISGRNAGGVSALASEGSSSTLTIVNCYNRGRVESWCGYRHAGGAGGILGSQIWANGRDVYIVNCYSTGEIVCDASLNENGERFSNGITTYMSFKDVSSKTDPVALTAAERCSYETLYYKLRSENRHYLTLSNNYYLSGSANGGVSGENLPSEAEAKSASALKKLADSLGDAYVADSNKINGGYPVLRWQAGQSEGSGYTFTISPNVSGAVVTVTDSFGNKISAKKGVYSAETGVACLYRAEAEGYLPATGCVAGDSGSQTIPVTLEKDQRAHKLILDTDVENATLKLEYYYSPLREYREDRNLQNPGEYPALYSLLSYKYVVSAEGYEDISGEFTCGEEDVTITARFKGAAEPEVKVGDLNGDTTINIFDLVLMRRHLVGLNPLKGDALLAADLNHDGAVNIFDLVIMRRFIVGLVKTL